MFRNKLALVFAVSVLLAGCGPVKTILPNELKLGEPKVIKTVLANELKLGEPKAIKTVLASEPKLGEFKNKPKFPKGQPGPALFSK